MSTEKHNALGGNHRAPNTEASRKNYTWTASFIKSLIVRAGCRGLIPRNFASWIIQRGGLRHE